MFVAIACVGILLAIAKLRSTFVLGELNGFLRTVLYACKTEITVSSGFHSLRQKFVISMRTNRYTGSATDAGVGYGKVILTFQNEAGIGINSRPFQKSLMLFALFLRDRFVPMFLFGNPGAYFFKFFISTCSFMSKLGSQLSTIFIVLI